MRLTRLDGLRGVAALGVVLLHYFPGQTGPGLFEHGYLAVDFFFLLSGFVIARTYEARLAGPMPLANFIRVRAIRLYPLVVLAISSVVVLRCLYPRPALPDAGLLREWLLNAALLPDLGRPRTEWFPLNAPTWSLFYELAVNIAYAALLPLLSRRALLGALLASGAALAFFAQGHGTVNTLHEYLVAGFARTVFSFSLGVWFFRERDRLPLAHAAIPSWTSYPLIMAIMAVPVLPMPWSWAFDLLSIGLLMPLTFLVALGQRPGAMGRGARAEELLGELSYPLYLLHMPAAAYVGVALGWAISGTPLIVVTVGVAVVGSLLASRLYDVPVRRRLARRPPSVPAAAP